MNLEAYEEFAWVYDAALGEPFAHAARSTIEKVITGYLGDARGPALDLACGSGLSTRMLSELGFRPVGLDASVSMLSIASSRAGLLVAGDIRKLPLRGPFPLVTCLYDSLNHMLNVPDLQDAMMEAAAMLAKDGVFVFDINQPEVYSVLWDSDEPFRHRDGSQSLTMQTSFDAASGIARAEIAGSIDAADGDAFTFVETRRQRAWQFEEIADAVINAGLRIDLRVDFDPFGQARDSGVGIKWLLAATHR